MSRKFTLRASGLFCPQKSLATKSRRTSPSVLAVAYRRGSSRDLTAGEQAQTTPTLHSEDSRLNLELHCDEWMEIRLTDN